VFRAVRAETAQLRLVVQLNEQALERQQAEVIQNHENEHVRSTGQGEARQQI
jgi:hypothetical protein